MKDRTIFETDENGIEWEVLVRGAWRDRINKSRSLKSLKLQHEQEQRAMGRTSYAEAIHTMSLWSWVNMVGVVTSKWRVRTNPVTGKKEQIR